MTQARDQRLTAGVPFFFKQWGGVRKKRAGRLLENWDAMPNDLDYRKEVHKQGLAT